MQLKFSLESDITFFSWSKLICMCHLIADVSEVGVGPAGWTVNHQLPVRVKASLII